jgi:hypothetical protein
MVGDEEHRRIRLSSWGTLGVRYILAPLMMLLTVLWVVYLFTDYGVRWYTILGIVVWMMIAIPFIRSMWRLCEVEADDDGLWVTRGRTTHFVHFENVVNVASASIDTWPKIRVTTRGGTVFGETFTFMPIMTNRFSPETPTIRWLKDRVREASRS